MNFETARIERTNGRKLKSKAAVLRVIEDSGGSPALRSVHHERPARNVERPLYSKAGPPDKGQDDGHPRRRVLLDRLQGERLQPAIRSSIHRRPDDARNRARDGTAKFDDTSAVRCIDERSAVLGMGSGRQHKRSAPSACEAANQDERRTPGSGNGSPTAHVPVPSGSVQSGHSDPQDLALHRRRILSEPATGAGGEF